MTDLKARDRAEEVALFRYGIIGGLCGQELARGELRAELRRLSTQRYRAPGAQRTRTFAVSTLERWYYAYLNGGLEALRPKPRADRGRARGLSAEQRELLCDIRREYPKASARLILKTLVDDGRLPKGAVSAATVRRLFRDEGIDRRTLRASVVGEGPRLRWQAAAPDALWHGDVCHGPSIVVDGKKRPLRIHALLDDATRYVVALEAHHTEQERDMLGLFAGAIQRHGAPDVLYLDNGSTYRGDALATACGRLGVSLVHAKPYDPEARGKMERFWRTLRGGCLDWLGELGSLHDVNVRLWAFLDQHYHVAPHAGLMGRAPACLYEGERSPTPVAHERLRAAFTERKRRRVRKDSTVSVAGEDFELDQSFLAGRLVTVAHCLLDDPPAPWVERDDTRYALHPVDPIANGAYRRRRKPAAQAPSIPFDPPGTVLDRALGRTPDHSDTDTSRRTS